PAVRTPAGVLSRASWAHGEPVPAMMDRMSPIRHITVHHDGMDPFFAVNRITVAAHLELIRQLHRRKGWGDIGYHFAVDRAGRVWEARPLVYQGAHVKDHNPGNIGVVVLGNFEVQAPTEAQMAAVRSHLSDLMRAYGLRASRVHTHQEWEGAATACPGERLQHYLDRLRRSGALG
ncbi:MAG: peptidoglycan recognition protein family protein, partial [Planctomycetota bacterium]